MEITLLEENGVTIRKIVAPVVQLDIANGNVVVSGKDVVRMANDQEYTSPMTQLCAKEPVFNTANPSEDDQAKIARNTAKETAKDTYLAEHETALKKYVKACFDIDNPVIEEA